MPRPDHFYYVRDGDWEAWFSLDGTRDGRILRRGRHADDHPGCVDGTYEYLGTKDRPQDASGFVDRVGDRGWLAFYDNLS